ncbi:MAG: EamA family transporter, partial [Candidatus Hydrogenedentes bacterium]|nr:EamA family transporter [Candidatus Hydrogenedentota bacterium]
LWSLYSNLTRRWGGGVDVAAVPLFMVATAVVLAGVRCFVHEDSQWSARALAELAYMAVFPTFLAYAFWDVAMRRGNVLLVAVASYFTPLLSTTITCGYLGVGAGVAIWAACALIIAGAIVCRRSIRD